MKNEEGEKPQTEVPGGMLDLEHGSAGGDLAAADPNAGRAFESGLRQRADEDAAKVVAPTTTSVRHG